MNAHHYCKKCQWPDAQAEHIDDPDGTTVAIRYVCGWCQHEEIMFYGDASG